jgi:hypothetical protein
MAHLDVEVIEIERGGAGGLCFHRIVHPIQPYRQV